MCFGQGQIIHDGAHKVKVRIDTDEQKAVAGPATLGAQGVDGVEEALEFAGIPPVCELVVADNGRGPEARRVRGQPEIGPRVELVSVELDMGARASKLDPVGVVALVRDLLSVEELRHLGLAV